MKLSEILAKPIRLISGGILNLKGFSKNIIDKELSKEFTIDDVVNFYTKGKIKKLSDLNVLLTSKYRITTTAASPDEIFFPYMALEDYTDDMQMVDDIVHDINSIATEGYFLMKYDKNTKAGCLCRIDVDRIDFICPINYDSINTYIIGSDSMVINDMLL